MGKTSQRKKGRGGLGFERHEPLACRLLPRPSPLRPTLLRITQIARSVVSGRLQALQTSKAAAISKKVLYILAGSADYP
jgi:hypothetical protein